MIILQYGASAAALVGTFSDIFYHISDKMESLCFKFCKYFAFCHVNVRIFFKTFLLNKKIFVYATDQMRK